MKKSLFITCLLCASHMVFSQDATPQNNTAANRLEEQLVSYPHEKIYVQTDKSAYISGERVWLRVHIVDATSNRPVFLSRYIYIELFNPFGELVKRVKVRPDETGAFAGHVDLEDDLAEGDYTIRAYTRYARNRGNDTFFKKSIKVMDPYSLSILPLPHFDVTDKKATVRFNFMDRVTGDTIVPEIVTLKLADEAARTISPDNGVDYSWSFPIDKDRGNRNILLGIVNDKRVYNRYYAIPHPDGDFDVSFHPEGGHLVPGHTCRVGFKAVNPSGLGESVSGKVYDSRDREVAVFTTYRMGMGSFHISVEPGEQYYAICETGNGSEKRVDLPQSEPKARTINVKRALDRVVATMFTGDGAADEQLSLLVHNKGVVLYFEPWSTRSDSYAFPSTFFPSGVSSMLLINGNNEILSERLVFNVNDADLAKINASLSAPSYDKRKKVTLKLKLSDIDTVSYYNNLAVSVIDKSGSIQETAEHLVSTLLLSSELRGHIESPASYFSGGNTDGLALDALMTTQGWRRYDIPAVLKGEISTPDGYEHERYQEISGKTEALLRNMKDGQISLMATLDTLFSAETTLADENGRFLFKVEYPENTDITVQSVSRKGGRGNLINLDTQTFPDASFATLPSRATPSYGPAEDIDAFIKQSNDAYSLKHGIRTAVLEEFTVTAQSIKKESSSRFYSPIASTSLVTSEDIDKRKVSNFRALLTTTPGLVVTSGIIRTTRSTLPVLFVIDDYPYPDFSSQIDMFDVNSIESMFVMRDNTFMMGYYPETSGAVVINTKGGFVQQNQKSMNIDQIRPLGYQQPAEFYSPKYETREDIDSGGPDLRTTIYWKPNVQFSRTGEAVVEFYTADTYSTYEVVGEGVTGMGKIIRFTEDIVVEKDDK